MPSASQPSQKYFEKFLEERFDRVFERLDVIKKKSDRRDLDVNMMDTINKSETKAIKDLIEKVADEFAAITDAQDKRIQNLEWIIKSIVWVIATVSGFILWVTGVWKNLVR